MKSATYILFIYTIITFVSCSPSDDNSTNVENIDSTKNAIDSLPLNLENIDLPETSIPTNIDYQGKIISSKKWQDKNGENIFILSYKKTNQSIYIYGYHYALQTDNTYNLLRKIKDMEENCDFDLAYNFYKDEISIKDNDDNKFAEITFCYSLECSSDVGAKRLKLLMLENGVKYAIRGYIPFYSNGTEFGGEKKVDNSFNNASNKLLNYANNVWDNIVNNSNAEVIERNKKQKIKDLKTELSVAEDMLISIKNRIFLSSNKKKLQLKEQYLKIENIKEELEYLKNQ